MRLLSQKWVRVELEIKNEKTDMDMGDFKDSEDGLLWTSFRLANSPVKDYKGDSLKEMEDKLLR